MGNRFSPSRVIKLTVVCAVLCLLIVSISTPNRPVAAATNGRIAYVTYAASSDLQIHSMNIDGSDDKELTNDPYMHLYPNYSPDGSKIAFVAQLPPNGNLQIVTMDADGSNQVAISADDMASMTPSWSPDGNKIAFAQAPADYSTPFRLYTANPDGTDLTPLTDGTRYSTSPSWKPDGSKLTYNCDGDQICAINRDGTNEVQLTSSGTPLSRNSPSFSPDGSKIAYINIATGYVQTIRVMNADGSNEQTVNTSGTSNDNVSWSPDGTKLLFDNYDTIQGVTRVYYINLDGTGETAVSLDNQYAMLATWQPIPAADSDGDGTPSSTEAAGPNSGDSNGDGIADKNQANVTSFLSTVTGNYVSLQSSCTSNNSVSASASPATYKDAAFSYPVGLLSFSLACGTAGTTASITQYYYGSPSSPTMVLRKYNNATHAYSTIPGAIISSITLGGKLAVKVTYPITDGGPLDQDGVSNGVIVDPVGIALPSVGAPNTGRGGSILLPWLSAAPSL